LFEAGGVTEAIKVGTWVRPVVTYSIFVVLAILGLTIYLTRHKREQH